MQRSCMWTPASSGKLLGPFITACRSSANCLPWRNIANPRSCTALRAAEPLEATPSIHNKLRHHTSSRQSHTEASSRPDAATQDSSASACQGPVGLTLSGVAAAPVSIACGYLEVITGPMFAGKTTTLLSRVVEQKSKGRRVAVVKSAKDTRYDAHHVVSHDGQKHECYAVPTLAKFKELAGDDYDNIQVIAIDEAQFFGDLLEFCQHAADHDRKVIFAAGLSGDFKRQRFGQVLDLVLLADKVTMRSARCVECGAVAMHPHADEVQHHEREGLGSAMFTMRVTQEEGQEVVGGADKYRPVCRNHFVQMSRQGPRASQ